MPVRRGVPGGGVAVVCRGALGGGVAVVCRGALDEGPLSRAGAAGLGTLAVGTSGGAEVSAGAGAATGLTAAGSSLRTRRRTTVGRMRSSTRAALLPVDCLSVARLSFDCVM
jgi:hypothetical protein